MPLLFPEPLPIISFIDRSQILRSKKASLESAAIVTEVRRTMEANGMMRLDGYMKTPSSASASGARSGAASGLDLGGMILPVHDGELLLRVVAAPLESSSRPVSAVNANTASNGNINGSEEAATSPSRTPSIRVKSAAAGLDRKSSRARRSSLPALSQRTALVSTEHNNEPPLHAVVQAGTLDALVHFLIHGLEGVSVSVADDNGEMALRDKKTRSVKIDHAEFSGVWWNCFRSFVSPYVLFQVRNQKK